MLLIINHRDPELSISLKEYLKLIWAVWRNEGDGSVCVWGGGGGGGELEGSGGGGPGTATDGSMLVRWID